MRSRPFQLPTEGENVTPIRVLIADDHPVVRNGLIMQIARASDMRVVGETGEGSKVLPLIRQEMPDVVVLDAVIPGVRTSTLVRRIKSEFPLVKIIVFSAYEDPTLVRGLLAAGVDGYMLKEEMLSRVVDAVREVIRGGMPLSSRIAANMREVWQQDAHTHPLMPEDLTRREREVLEWMVRGLSNRSIAEKLHVTERTVKFHVGNILGKLGARSRVEAVRIAIEKGLVDV